MNLMVSAHLLAVFRGTKLKDGNTLIEGMNGGKHVF